MGIGERGKQWDAAKSCARTFDDFQLQAACMQNEKDGYDEIAEILIALTSTGTAAVTALRLRLHSVTAHAGHKGERSLSKRRPCPQFYSVTEDTAAHQITKN